MTMTNQMTILGFGSLLSESSSRLTFPTLTNFRVGRVPNYRRVFAHPASIFFQRNIANVGTMEMSSLSVEPCDGASLVCSIFEVPTEGLVEEELSKDDWNGSNDEHCLCLSQAFREREEEFDIKLVPYEEIADYREECSRYQMPSEKVKMGVLCTRSTDEAYITKWGQDHFDLHYKKFGIDTIWNFSKDSGLRPCAVYLRHCVLAAQSMGDECYNSFLDETFLVDRTTTVREYLQQYPDTLNTLPPPELASRYGG